MNYPIIIVAFGTTVKARATYAQVDTRLKTRFAHLEKFNHQSYNPACLPITPPVHPEAPFESIHSCGPFCY